MEDDDVLTKEEIKLEKKMKVNYFKCYSYLVASNINSIYSIYGKQDNEYNYEMIKKMSMDTFPLSKKEIKFIDKHISKYLKEQFELKIVDKRTLKLKKLKNYVGKCFKFIYKDR